MAIATKPRRVVLAKVEAARGTAETLVAATDGIPMIREADAEIEPSSVDRGVLRQSFTSYADLYPGKALVTMNITTEVCGRDTGFPVSQPNWTRLFRMCAFSQLGNAAKVRAYRVSVLTTENGPLRHGEALKGAAGSTALGGADGDNVPVGDSFSHDGGALTTIFIDEGAADGDGIGTISSNRGANETVFTVDQRSTVSVNAWMPQSDVNNQVAGTIELYKDGKRIRMKGAVGNCTYQFRHGDATLARFTMRGVFNLSDDIALPTDAFEGHRVPPAFLGSRLSLSSPTNNPAPSDRYGTGGSGSNITGSLSEVDLETGNELVLQPNALDPDGISFGFVSSRTPAGKLNPHEVLNSEFNFIQRFVAGSAARMHILVGGTLHNDVTTFDQNTFEFLTPGVVLNQMGDADRDGVNIWDASFKLTGGDYDSSATGELPGSDNEFIMIHR